jgi:hypothetical protein
MQAHVVLAHPEPRSFNAHLAQVARRALEAQGWSVSASDLYGMGFDPCERADPPASFTFSRCPGAGIRSGRSADRSAMTMPIIVVFLAVSCDSYNVADVSEWFFVTTCIFVLLCGI